MSAGLGGTGMVADDLYLLAHHDVTGKPLLQPRPLSIGLAGGLLAELMLGGSIGLRHDGAVAAQRSWPADDLARYVRDQIAAEPEPRLVREWLLFLARSTAGDVACRLERAGYLRHARRRVPFRSGRWVPVDSDWAFTPMLRVRAALDPARPLVSQQAVLAGLAVACGLGFRLDQYVSPAGRSVQETVGQLGPGLRGLITQTQVAIDGAVLSHRA
jgi:Golgi phosphoprotein 3 (GPP34)